MANDDDVVHIAMTAEGWYSTVEKLRAGDRVPGMCLCMNDDLTDICVGLIVDGVIGAKIPRPDQLGH
jgi:hypothetical protein